MKKQRRAGAAASWENATKDRATPMHQKGTELQKGSVGSRTISRDNEMMQSVPKAYRV